MSENLNKIIAQYGTVKGKLIDTTRPVERRDEQNRPDAPGKLSKFMTAEDIEHCPPSDSDWLAAFNDHSPHQTVIGLLGEAIAQSEPCFECGAVLTPETIHFVTIEDEPEQVLCDQCSLLA